jgi:dephospho-CoA kinase
MHVYGLTGGIGSGKSAVAGLLEEYGIPVVSADELSRMVVAKGTSSLQAVVEAFGEEVLSDDGELDRKAMAKIVFADADKRRELESILHPKIRERFEAVLEALKEAGHDVVVYEVPLLFEKKLQGDMHAVILVTAGTELRIARVMARDETSREQVEARMRTQMPEAEKRALANYLVLNDGDLDDLRREVQIIISRFFKIDPNPHLSLMPTAKDEAEASARSEAQDAPGSEETQVGRPDEPLPPSKIDTIIQVPREAPPPSATLAAAPRVPPPPSSSAPATNNDAGADTIASDAGPLLLPPPPKVGG